MTEQLGKMSPDAEKLREAYACLKVLLEEARRHRFNGTVGIQIQCERGEPKQIRRLMNVAN